MRIGAVWFAGVLGCLAACSSGFSSDGFKSVKFGMDLASLRLLGFDCKEQDYFCDQSPTSPKETLFGKDTTLTLETEKGRVESITVSVSMPPSDLIGQYEKQIGKPEKYTYDTASGGQAEQFYWLSKDGTSISVVKPRVAGWRAEALPAALQVQADNMSSARYLGVQKTKELLGRANGNKVNATDM